ncbi:MAG: class I SAM-dependent methyltransferase [Sulfolobales archaeon]
MVRILRGSTEKKLIEVVNSLERIAGVYDMMSSVITLGLERIFRSYVKNFVIGLKILDIGAGTGAMYNYLRDRIEMVERKYDMKPIYIFLEPLAPYLRILRKKYSSDPYIEIVQGYAEYLPFRVNSIDVAVSSFMLRDVKNLSKALVSIFRVSRKFVVLDFHKPDNVIAYLIELFYTSLILPLLILAYSPWHVLDYMNIRTSIIIQNKLGDLLRILKKIFGGSDNDIKCWFLCIVYSVKFEKSSN